MLSRRLKSAARFAIPTTLAIGRVLSNIQALFTVPKWMEYITGQKNPYKHPATLPLVLIAAIANIFVNLATRVPNMYKKAYPPLKPRNNKLDAEEKSVKQEDDFDDILEEPSVNLVSPEVEKKGCFCCDSNSCCGCFKGLNPAGASVYVLFKALGLGSGIFSSFSAFLGAYNIAEVIASMSESDAHDEEWKEYLMFGVGIYFFLCNFSSFLYNNYTKIDHNSKAFAQFITHADFSSLVKSAVALTGFLSAFNLLGLPGLAKLSTESALTKLEGLLSKIHAVAHLPENVKIGFGYASSATATASQITGTLPSFYRALSAKKKTAYVNERRWEKPFTGLTGGMAVIDAAAAGCGNFTGFIHMLSSNGIQSNNPVSLLFAILSGLSTSALTYFFTMESKNDTLRYFHELNDEFAYEAVAQDHLPMKTMGNFGMFSSNALEMDSDVAEKKAEKPALPLDFQYEIERFERRSICTIL